MNEHLDTGSQTTPTDASPDEASVAENRWTESPWLWACVFVAGAILSLVLATPRFSYRQPQIERQFLARQNGGQVITGRDGPIQEPRADRLILSLRPLYWILAATFAVAWAGFWWQRSRGRAQGN